MARKRKTPVEELVVPPQNRQICGTICICQMTAILSSVAIVYLSVAVYFPSMRAFYSGIVEQPLMCSTSKVVTVDKCNWGSCGEWCLSKTSGACIQIYVNLRQNGTTLEFQKCENAFNKTCYGMDRDSARKYRCKQEECKNLTGTFNCTSGTCINVTDVFECVFGSTGDPLNCTGPRGKINCMDIDGLNSCAAGICARINVPYNCDRRCVDIPTRNKNVILLNGDRVFVAWCESVIVSPPNASIGNDTDASLRFSLTNESDWKSDEPTALMASCYVVATCAPDLIRAEDCINGTLVDKAQLSDLSNFTFLYGLTIADEKRSDLETQIAPLETQLLVANDSRLMINLEGCVNTLRDECRQFLKDFGRDGGDHNAKARFPCYYADADPSLVVTRFSLETTYREFVPAAIIPSVLLVLSCLILVLCQQTVEVGNDARMRFKTRKNRALFLPLPVVKNDGYDTEANTDVLMTNDEDEEINESDDKANL